MHLPPGTHFENWILVYEKGRPAIRRHATLPDGSKKFERLPKQKYRHLIGAPARELEDFVVRLNGKDPQEQRALKNPNLKPKSEPKSEKCRANFFSSALLLSKLTAHRAAGMYSCVFFLNSSFLS